MFVPLWLIFLGSGLLMAVLTVVWAIRTHQFDDQNRARFLPLTGMTEEELTQEPKRRFRAEYIGTWTMVALGLGSIAGALVLTLVN